MEELSCLVYSSHTLQFPRIHVEALGTGEWAALVGPPSPGPGAGQVGEGVGLRPRQVQGRHGYALCYLAPFLLMLL